MLLLLNCIKIYLYVSGRGGGKEYVGWARVLGLVALYLV